MRYANSFSVLLCLAMLATGFAGRAQTDSNVYNERVVVTSRYKPVVEEMPKINVAPTIFNKIK